MLFRSIIIFPFLFNILAYLFIALNLFSINSNDPENNTTSEDQNREVTADLEEMRQNALKSGILSQADENTRRILTSIVATTDMEAEIVFDDGEGEVLRLETQDSTPEKVDAEQDLSPASVEATADE